MVNVSPAITCFLIIAVLFCLGKNMHPFQRASDKKILHVMTWRIGVMRHRFAVSGEGTVALWGVEPRESCV